MSGHKLNAWADYLARRGEYGFERWSNVYEANQTRARLANQAVDAYQETLGWGKREVTVQVNVDGDDYDRRLDIADLETRRAIEYKTGYQTATEDNLQEIARDRALTRQGWNIQWVFRDTASKPLKAYLTDAGIPYRGG